MIVDFLLHLRVRYPDAERRASEVDLVAAELERARELLQAGVIQHIWRIPGRWENWSVWSAQDATALHAILEDLPLWPWLEIDVHPLADHPAKLAGTARAVSE